MNIGMVSGFYKEMNTKKLGLLVLLLAILFRIVFLLYIDSPVYFGKYPYFASKLSQGESIGTRIVDLSPFYLYLLTAWHKCFGPLWEWLKVVQAVLGSFNCLLIYALGIRFFNPWVGLLAGCMASMYGNMIVLESTLEPTVFVLLFSLLAVYFLSNVRNGSFADEHPIIFLAIAGFFTGLSIITKPSFLLFLPVAWIFFLFLPRPAVTLRILYAIAFTVITFIVILPISVRNYIGTGDYVLVTADAGKVFFHGNGPGANALETTILDDGLVQEKSDEPDYEHTLFRQTAERILGRPLLPSEASRFWFDRTLKHIFDQPSEHLRLIVQKLAFFFTDYELHYIGSAFQEYKKTRHLPFLRYGWVVGFGLIGMFLSVPVWRKHLPLYGAFCVYLATCLIFIVQSRYRMPAMPYLCLFAAYALVTMFRWLCERKISRATLIGIIAFSLSFFSFIAFRQTITRVDRHQTAVQIHYLLEARPLFEKRDFKGAVLALNRSIRLEPDYAPPRLLRGGIYVLFRQYGAAEKDFLRVISMEPNSIDGYKNLGLLYLLQGLNEKALPMLKKARDLGPSDTTVLNALKRIKGESSKPVTWEFK